MCTKETLEAVKCETLSASYKNNLLLQVLLTFDRFKLTSVGGKS